MQATNIKINQGFKYLKPEQIFQVLESLQLESVLAHRKSVGLMRVSCGSLEYRLLQDM